MTDTTTVGATMMNPEEQKLEETADEAVELPVSNDSPRRVSVETVDKETDEEDIEEEEEEKAAAAAAAGVPKNPSVRRSVVTFAGEEEEEDDIEATATATAPPPRSSQPGKRRRTRLPSVLTASRARRQFLYQRFNLKTSVRRGSVLNRVAISSTGEGNETPEPGDEEDQATTTTGSTRRPRPRRSVKQTVQEFQEQVFPKSPPKQGRLYSKEYSEQPGGLRLDDMIYGLQMAQLACTDDSEDRLKTSSSNTLATLQHIVGKDDFRKPLSTILQSKFHLALKCWIDESGIFYGRPVDSQGFIAASDTTMVLSYRFTTSALDWMTNFSMTVRICVLFTGG